MRYIGDERRFVWSASDLKSAAECEFAWLRLADAKLGRVPVVDEPRDETRERAGRLGTAYEQHVLARYVAEHGERVVQIPHTMAGDAEGLAAAVAATRAALDDPDVLVVYQAAFSAPDFVGFADFLVREGAAGSEPAPVPEPAPVREPVEGPAAPPVLGHASVPEPVEGPASGRPWVVQDTKLARRARVTALMQLAAYADRLDAMGVARSDRVELLLGDGSVSAHAADDLLPVFRLRRARLLALLEDRHVAAGAAGTPIPWGDPRGDLEVFACGRCATCELEVVAHRDLLLVAGMRPNQRQRLRAEGIETIDDLAAANVPPLRMGAEAFAGLVVQARLQLESPAGLGIPVLPDSAAPVPDPAAPAPDPARPVPEPVEGSSSAVLSPREEPVIAAAAADAGPSADLEDAGAEASASPPPIPAYRVVMPTALGALPRPDHGDLFFDFEGDPLHLESGRTELGLDYLFGWVDDTEVYTALWAHDFAAERVALERFLAVVGERRARHPAMHIYHYAPYEPSHLLAMAARHGVGEAEVDELLRDQVFVDLYPVVRRALRVGSRSYSIKKLEPLYMGAEVRTSDVQRGDDSIVRYVEARSLVTDGDDVVAALAADATATAILDDLADYNRYDCVSTLRLRDWLVARAIEHERRPAAEPEPQERAYRPSERAETLRALAVAAVERAGADTADAQALRLGAAAIDYYPREAKSFWATHFLRLREPVSVWEDTRDVVVVDESRTRVVEEWGIPEGGRTLRRVLEVRGDVAPGTRLADGIRPFLLYEAPAPFVVENPSPRSIHVPHGAAVVEVVEDGAIVEERAVVGETWDEFPIAITPPGPPGAGNQQAAIDAWADAVAGAAPGFPADAATDLLRRIPPRTRGAGDLSSGHDDVEAIVRTLLDLDRSYVAVQGPPGTGKTYTGSHVIAHLAREHGWRIGVVSQGHATVEHMLGRVVAAGVDPGRVAKALKGDPDGSETFTVIRKDGVAEFTASHPDGGFVVGGTAWDFSHQGRFPRGSLDLLVIDEAGQFSLASTTAVSLAAQRLLLLGDPQQLPQVSQGTHPEPVDTSALGWLMAGSETIAADRGFFLAETRRMHPAVAAPVSRLAYAGRLAAHPSTAERRVEGLEAGVHADPIRHRGNATQSPEEAMRVVEIVRDLLGRTWHDPDAAPRPLGQSDVIVVTPYNAQQVLVEEALVEAGLGEVPVGTVDRFQGQEAVIAIVSLAASSGRDAPRGLEFLLLQNRLNVAVSRAKYAAYVLYAPGLLDDLPRTPEGVVRLSAFARLVGAGAGASDGLVAADSDALEVEPAIAVDLGTHRDLEPVPPAARTLP